MRRGATFIAISLLLATAADAKGPIDDWQGVYKIPGEIELFTGAKLPSVDLLEIVRVTSTRAYVNLELNFPTGGVCSFHGLMTEEGKRLVYFGPTDKVEPSDCILSLEKYSSPEGPGVVIHDENDTCRTYTCGARAAFDGARFGLSIRDTSETGLEAVRNSRSYQRMLAEQKP